MNTKIRRQKGFALVAAMAAGVIAMSITAAVLLRMSSSTTQIARQEKHDEALSLSEAVMNHTLDYIADFDASEEGGVLVTTMGSQNKYGIYYSATELASELQTQLDFMGTVSQANHALKFSNPSMSASQYKAFPTVASDTFYTSLESNNEHSQKFWDAFKKPDSGNFSFNGTLDLDSSSTYSVSEFSLDDMHAAAGRIYHVTKGGLEADVRISIVPLATDVEGVNENTLHTEATFSQHDDVLKIQVESRIPSWSQPRSTKIVEVIVNRPVKLNQPDGFILAHAVYSGRSLNMQNGNSSAGACAAGSGGAGCIDTTVSGDVHSNTSVSLGANAKIQGKVTSAGTVNSNGTDVPSSDFVSGSGDPRETDTNITDRIDDPENSKSDVEEVPFPDFNTDTTSVDGAACADAGDISGWVHYSDCYLSSLNLKKSDTPIAFSGVIHVQGNWVSKGATRCVGTETCRIIVNGTADLGGNATADYSEQDTIFIVTSDSVTTDGTTCMDLGGNPDAYGSNGTLVVVTNPLCNTVYHGNFEFFGGIMTAGTFENKGNASSYGIQRDVNFAVRKEDLNVVPADKSALYPDVVSWKDR